MNKEEIEEAKECLNKIIQNTYAEEKAIKLDNLRKYIEYLETKLDKVAEYCKRFEYETEPIGDDDYLTERALVCEEILNIIEGEKNERDDIFK